MVIGNTVRKMSKLTNSQMEYLLEQFKKLRKHEAISEALYLGRDEISGDYQFSIKIRRTIYRQIVKEITTGRDSRCDAFREIWSFTEMVRSLGQSPEIWIRYE